MKSNLTWKIHRNLRDDAMAQGEDIANVFDFPTPPIDPLAIIKQEPLIYAEGADFGNAFDGCLEYLGKRYLLGYNTKYNRHEDAPLHPRARFTIAHELGHYFLDTHRNLLQSAGFRYSCTTERFESDTEMELQADYFATGLLMPSAIIAPIVNRTPEPDLATIQEVSRKFQVSMTSMLHRWVKISDFPCALLSVSPKGGIEWGWVSEPLFNIGAYHRRPNVVSSDAKHFLQSTNSTSYKEGHGKGLLHYWLDTKFKNLSIEEFYAAIPHTTSILVFIFAYDDEIQAL